MAENQNPRHNVRCKVIGNALGKSKEKGTPSVRIRLRSIAGVNNPAFEGYPEERDLWADLWLTDNTIESTIETLEKTLGWHGKSFAELNEPCFQDIEVVAVCEWEQVGDKYFERVVFLNRVGGGGVKKLDEDQVKDVVGKLDAVLTRHRQNTPGTGTARTAARPGTSRPNASTSTGKKAAPSGVNDFPGYAPPAEEGGF